MSNDHPAPRTSRSRLLSLVVMVGLVGAPAAVLRALCVGKSCAEQENATSEVPFCSLAEEQRDLIEAGFEGELHRSPDLLGVTRSEVVVGGGTAFGADDAQPAWPSTDAGDPRVPLIFWGAGVDPEAEVPAGTGLDEVAPTIAEIIGFDRPHPEVRSGEALAGVASGGEPPLVVEVVLKNMGSSDVEGGGWPNLRGLLAEGAGTLEAVTGSLPTDPAAILTTIGTGGLPHQHGVVGSLVRNDGGEVVRAWGPRAPVHIIATLPDDLDEELDQEPLIGLVQSDVSDRGLVGGDWYIGTDEDRVVRERSDPAAAVGRLLEEGFGEDEVPDVLAVALAGDATFLDAQLGRIAALIQRHAGEALLVVAGSGGHPESDVSAAQVQRRLEQAVPGAEEVVKAMVPGGIYLDQRAFSDSDITEDDVLKEFGSLEATGGGPLLADAFPAIAVSFARYC